MKFNRVGHSGLVVSAVGLGANNLGMKLDMEQSREVVHAALDAGITLFDTSDSYGESEARLGEILEGRRANVIIATKFGSDVRKLGQDNGPDWGARGSRRYIRLAVEASLRKLRTDWIDLYQMHHPDPGTPIEETMSTLTDLVREGKIRFLGHSNLSGIDATELEWIARSNSFERFVSAQNEYNLMNRTIEQTLTPALERHRIGLLPYYPLASGILTGKYQRGQEAPDGSRLSAWGLARVLTDPIFDKLERITQFARDRGVSLLQVAMGGLAAERTVSSIIAGATSKAQVMANVTAAEWKPLEDDLRELRRITIDDTRSPYSLVRK